MQVTYECQICKHSAENRPPEWCPRCGGHRVIFKRIVQRFLYPVAEPVLVKK